MEAHNRGTDRAFTGDLNLHENLQLVNVRVFLTKRHVTNIYWLGVLTGCPLPGGSIRY